MKGMIYLKRTTEVLQLRIQQLHRALGYGSAAPSNSSFVRMDPLPTEQINNIHDRTIKGVKLFCVEIESEKGGGGSGRAVCINSSSGMPVRGEPYREESWEPVGTKMFPSHLSYIENGKYLVDIEITGFKIPRTFPPSTFEPPVGSTSRRGCMNPVPVYSLNSPQLTHIEFQHVDRTNMPINELPASRPRLGGQALIYSVIGTDGVPQNVRVIAGDDPAWTSAFVSMIKKTEFAPATCDGQAVEVEMINAFVY